MTIEPHFTSAPDERDPQPDIKKEPMQDQNPTAANATPQDTPQDAALSPEALMQEATARITALEAELTEMKERWMRAEAETRQRRARARRGDGQHAAYAVQKNSPPTSSTTAENLKRGLDSLPPASATSRRSSPRSERVWKASSAAFCRRWSATASRATIRPASRSTRTCTRRWRSKRAKPMPRDHSPGVVSGLDVERSPAAAGDGRRREGAAAELAGPNG